VEVIDHRAFWLLRNSAQYDLIFESGIANQRHGTNTRDLAVCELDVNGNRHTKRIGDVRLVNRKVQYNGSVGGVGERTGELFVWKGSAVDVLIKKTNPFCCRR